MVELPNWFGLRYPTLADLEAYAEQLDATVVWTRAGQPAFDPGDDELGPALYVPLRAGLLEQAWFLAHELGHLVLHTGPKGSRSWSRGEAQASRWAACALIPEARIRMYGNASEDAMVAALSANFEDLPLVECPQRNLAGYIARIRLSCLEEPCVNR